MRTTMKCILVLLLLAQPQSGPRPALEISRPQATSCQPSEMNEYEAEILLYLLPASVASRNKGGQVVWELQSSPGFNQKDFYVFYVYNLKAPDYSSPTIGYFGVNKHTAEVWDMNWEEFAQSKDVLAVEKILQKGHCMDENTLKTYSSRRPEIQPK
jgi:hypothetical protein